MAPPLFDPRQIPVDAVDAHLSAVDHSELQADALVRRFAMPPVWRAELPGDHSAAAGKVLRRAAVLVPIVVGAEPTVLLTQRTHELSSHPGQIAFPGGRIDPEDLDEADAALREAFEEVGLERRFVTVLGNLPIYATGSAYSVTPVVALVQPGFSLRPNSGEVAEVFEVPLSHFTNPANHRWHSADWEQRRRRWLSMPYLDERPGAEPVERYVWGITAGILRNLYRFLIA
jgi:8-oxo-dGTP pyrophosphatase MutT (NUDIX family)